MARRWLASLVVLLTLLPPTPAHAAGPVCDVFCDGRDPAAAGTDRVAATAGLGGTTLRLHVADADGMAWATLDAAGAGDEVWLDRSYDAGRNWDGRVGNAAGAGTAMFTVDDPARHAV